MFPATICAACVAFTRGGDTPMSWLYVLFLCPFTGLLFAGIGFGSGSVVAKTEREEIKFYLAIGIGFILVCFLAWLFWGHWNGISSSLLSGLIIGVLIIVSLTIYFLPTYIARKRSHKNFAAIFALNLLTGWSFVGWVIALVWSLKND